MTTSADRTIHHLRVHLVSTSPAIWRRIEIESHGTLAALHDAIQSAMPWSGDQAHETFVGDARYGARGKKKERGLEDEAKANLRDVAPEVGSKLEYVYDYEDEWWHEIEVEAIGPVEAGVKYPRVVDGEGAPPLEGIGGPMVWSEILEARVDEDAEVRAEAEDLLGEGFDPAALPKELGVTPTTRPGDVPASASELRATLVRFGALLTERLRARVKELGESAAPALNELLALEPEGLDEATSWAQMHAARLAGELRLASTIPALVRIVETAALDTPIGQDAADALIGIGAAAVEPLLEARARTTDDERKSVLTVLLGHLGAKDERIYTLLLEALEDDLVGAAAALGQYGDPRAIEVLTRHLDASISGDEGDAEAIFTLAGVIEDLGGKLTDAQAKAAGEAEADLEGDDALDDGEDADLDDEDEEGDEGDEGDEEGAVSAGPQQPVRKAAKPGRNDPCWCGSGKKYKKCHLATDPQ